MATIRCMNPSNIGTQMEEMFNVTNTTGKNIVNKLPQILKSLRSSWRGTDATIHFKNLSIVFNAIINNIGRFQMLIVGFNNEKIRALQQHIVNSGSSCKIGKTLSTTIMIEDISKKAKENRLYVQQEFFTCVDDIKQINKDYQKFIHDLKDAKEALAKNLTSGCEIEQFLAAYKTLQENAVDNRRNLVAIINELNIVVSNKKRFFN